MLKAIASTNCKDRISKYVAFEEIEMVWVDSLDMEYLYVKAVDNEVDLYVGTDETISEYFKENGIAPIKV